METFTSVYNARRCLLKEKDGTLVQMKWPKAILFYIGLYLLKEVILGTKEEWLKQHEVRQKCLFYSSYCNKMSGEFPIVLTDTSLLY